MGLMGLLKSQIETLDALLEKKGYGERRRKTAISHIQGFFDTVKKSPKEVTTADIKEYLGNTNNSHMKFWVRFFYSDLLIHLYVFKFTRLEKRLRDMGFDDLCFSHILNLCRYSNKHLSRITKEDVDRYIQINNISGDELLKVQSIFRIFTTEEPKKKKFIILSKNKEALSYDEMKEKLSHADVRGLIARASQIDKHYCIKMNTMVRVCRMNICEFYAYSCPAHKPIIPPVPDHICDAHVPINFPVPA